MKRDFEKKTVNFKTGFLLPVFLLSTVSTLSAGNGILKGKIADGRTQEILPGASVVIKEIPNKGVVSDIDGNYSITLPEGTYTVVASYVSYATLEITKVEIKSDEAVTLDIDLKETTQDLGEVTVVARMDMEAEKALMIERQQATVAVENLGAKEMSMKGLSTVADGIKKVTGISMEGNSKVYVRGLGDRYSMTSLNGFPIASPNPDNKLIPLTLFPTSTVKNVSVSKVYQPSVFGDYSGAHINVDTKENIGKDYLTFSLSTGGKTNILFSDFYSSDKTGAGVPFLGISNGLNLNKNIKAMTADAFEDWQRTNNPFQTGFSVRKNRALPAVGLDFGMGKTWRAGAQKLSVLLAAGFNNDRTWYKDACVSTINAQGVVRDEYQYDKYIYETTATLLGQVGYTLGKNGRISYNVMLVNNTEDNYMRREGVDAEGIELIGSNSVYHACGLFNSQLTGKHELLRDKWFADWQVSRGRTKSDEPDRRQVMFTRNGNHTLSLFKLNRQETMRYFGELSEDEWNGDLKIKHALGTQSGFIRAGGSVRSKRRDFYSSNFYYNLKNISPQIDDIYDTDHYLHYGNMADGTVTADKNSLPRNKYYAGMDICAAFADMEYYPAAQLLVSFGLRYEHSAQHVRFWTDAAEERRAVLATDDLFPAVNLKYNINRNGNLRLGISRTVTRPSFLEMAPFEYKESYGGATVRGYERITNGYNYNLDLRYELFHGFGDMYSFGVYCKYLKTPIERVQEYSGSLIQSFRNVDKGNVAGAELEIRRQLTKSLKIDFNASYIFTRISLPEKGLYTDNTRRLQGASPWLVNLDINYAPVAVVPGDEKPLSFAAVYNLQGARISSVGINGVNNVIEEAVHSLDFIASYAFGKGMKVKLQGRNLLNPEHRFTQKIKDTGKNETVEYFRKGVDIGIGFSMDF